MIQTRPTILTVGLSSQDCRILQSLGDPILAGVWFAGSWPEVRPWDIALVDVSWAETVLALPPAQPVIIVAPRVALRQVVAVLQAGASDYLSLEEPEALSAMVRQLRARYSNQYQSFFDNALEGIYQSTPAGYYLNANPALARMYGYASPSDLMSNLTDIRNQLYVDPLRRDEFVKLLHTQGKTVDFEAQIRHRDGSLRWISENGRVVYNDHGEVDFYEGIVEDITHRKQVEKALWEVTKRYRMLADYATDMITHYDRHGVCLYASPATKTLFGYESSEFVNREFIYYVHPEDRHLLKKNYHLLASSSYRNSITQEYRIQHKNGHYLWVESTAQAIQCETNGLEIISVTRDINTRKQTEHALRQSEEQNRALIQALPDVMLRYHYDGTLLDFKAGKQDSIWFRQNRYELKLPASLEQQLQDLVKQAIEIDTLQTLEFELDHMYEARIVRSGELEAVCMIRDITDRKAAESRRQALELAELRMAELARINRLKDDFISSISHELRTPLATMRMAIHLLRKNPTEKRTTRYLDILEMECTRETNLINDLLDIQHLEEKSTLFKPKPLIIHEWLPKLIAPFEQTAHLQNQTLSYDLPADTVILTCDPLRIERVIIELINNACKYTPPHHWIRVTVEPTTAETITLTVSNSGVTIAPEELPRIFDKFYRIPVTDPWARGGTGLGLALCKSLVEQLNGNLQVESADDITSFSLILPNLSVELD